MSERDDLIDAVNLPLTRWQLLRLACGRGAVTIKFPAQGEPWFTRETWIIVRRKRNGVERLAINSIQFAQERWPRR